jgi:hypothetical protein
MQIPVADPMAGYPQPYATWATVLRHSAEVQGDDRAVSGGSEPPAEAATLAYIVDYTA